MNIYVPVSDEWCYVIRRIRCDSHETGVAPATGDGPASSVTIRE